MYLLCIVLIVIAAVLMCFIVLIQNSKGGGLASGFASSNQIMGVRKTTDFLEKATWSLAAFMVVISIASAHILASEKAAPATESVMMEQNAGGNAANPANAPGFNTPEEGQQAGEQQAQPAKAEQQPAQQAPAKEAPATPAK